MELDQSFKERMRWSIEVREPPCTQSELARHLEMSPQAVQQWVSGATSNPRRDKLLKAAEYLGVRFDWLAFARGPMRMSDDKSAAVGQTAPTEAALLMREWESALAVALPSSAHPSLHAAVQHPNGTSRFRVDFLGDDVLAMVGLYRSAAAVIKARERLWQLIVARELVPPIPGRRFMLILSPLEEWRDVPERHIEALRSEARLVGIEVFHVRTPVEAAALLLGKVEHRVVSIEDDLGLDSSPVL